MKKSMHASEPSAAIGDEAVSEPKLTERQAEILALIQRAITQSGAPPTRAEIARELGFRSANAAEDHLQALSRKGVIELVGGTSRGIRLRSPTRPSVSGMQRALPLAALAQLSLPLIGRVAAGHPILAQQHIDRHYTVGAQLFSGKPDYLLTVHGMSMCKIGIVDGDLLAVQQSKTARDGQIVVARLGEDVTVKRLRRSGGQVELVPENDDFDVIRIAADDDGFELEGIVVGLIRRSL